MFSLKKSFCCFYFICCHPVLPKSQIVNIEKARKQTISQSGLSIPAFTAYAVPAEKTNGEEESSMFSKQNGIQNWSDTGQQIRFYFKVRNKGKLHLALLLNPGGTGSKLSASIAGNSFFLTIPYSNIRHLAKIGAVQITDTGFYVLTLSCISKKEKNIAAIQSLELSGGATINMHFNSNERRNAASVHLFYPLADSIKALSFYNEITVPFGADPLHSYYMACGFSRGYFGIQVNSPGERRVIFSVWDAGNETTDRNKVADENKVKLLAKGENVFADGFGNEGTGGHSHWIYDWKAGETYRFLVTAATDSASNTTSYAGYFFIPETQNWKLIACFKSPKDGKPLHRLYSFVENFEGCNGNLFRKAFFGNQWIKSESGNWKELTQSTFSYDATGKTGYRIDQGGGADSNRFYLWNGGFKPAQCKIGDDFKRISNPQKPLIDLYRNADSLVQANTDKLKILDAVRSGKFDTTGSNNGIYYTILKEGSGDWVNPNDTIVVNYKGSLLNGEIFDETKGKPAIFPLRRLIKGWQTGIPYCKQGGKIRLIIPSALAYTIRNLGEIPPNNVLIFDIEVLEIKKGRP